MSQPELVPLESVPFEPHPAQAPVYRVETPVQPLATMTPMEMISAAVSQGQGIELVSRLMDLQDRVEAKEAQKAFTQAMSRVQSKMRQVNTDASNPQTHSKYATYAAIDAALRPIYSEEGFSLSFDSGETATPETIRVLCHVAHSGGHTKTYHIDMPSDGKGAKGNDVMTKTHASGAAMSYGMRYLLKMIFNVAVGEYDNDGNGAGATDERMPEEVFQEHKANIMNASNHKSLHMAFTVAYVAAQATKNKEDMGLFIKARDARKAVLDKEAK